MSKVSIEIFKDEASGRKGGIVYMDKDMAKRYVEKKKAKYVTITDSEPKEEKVKKGRKPSEEVSKPSDEE